MTRVFPFLRAAIPTLLLAVVAPSTTGLQADTPVKVSSPKSASAYSVLIATGISNAKPAVERLPKSELAWEFDHESDGSVAIKGPNGTIWQGNLRVGMGPTNPPGMAPGNPNYRLYITPSTPGQKPFYEFVPSPKSAPSAPNFAPILPPGKSQPHFILPEITP
jgi:hypothetical protein